MKSKPTDLPLRWMVLLAGMLASWGSAWAAPDSCAYPTARAQASGTGMGGTGDVAQGTGIGGTGIRLGVYMNEMQFAGNVSVTQGSVEAQRNGSSRFLAKGDPVCAGDTIITSQSGSVQIRMADGGLIAARPQTQLRIEKFVYSGTNKDASALALLKGACRIVSGKIGKQHPENDMLKTSTATISVREADHEVTVILPGESGGYPSGTYDKVNSGIAILRTEQGGVDIYPSQVGFAAGSGESPTLLNGIPGFYTRPGDGFSEQGK